MSFFSRFFKISEPIKEEISERQEVVVEVAKIQEKNPYRLLPEPKGYKFGKRSLENLKTCHPDIQSIMHEAIKYTNFSVLEGSRSKQVQDEYFAKGTSKVRFPNSYHNTKITHIKDEFLPDANLYGAADAYCSLAIDIVPYPIDWNDMKRFHDLSLVIKTIAEEKDIPLDWGFDLWSWDAPHYQLTSYRKGKK